MAIKTPTYLQAKTELIEWARTVPAIHPDSIAFLETLDVDTPTGFTGFGHAKTGRAYVFVNLHTAYHAGARFPAAVWAAQAKDQAERRFLGLPIK